MTRSQHVYEPHPRKDHCGFDLICDVLPFGRLWYGEPDAVSNAIGYAKFRSRSHDAVIRVYDEAGQCDRKVRILSFLHWIGTSGLVAWGVKPIRRKPESPRSLLKSSVSSLVCVGFCLTRQSSAVPIEDFHSKPIGKKEGKSTGDYQCLKRIKNNKLVLA
jgi:hypothetical protein